MNPSLAAANLAHALHRFDIDLQAVPEVSPEPRPVTTPDLHRPGLALVGHFFHHHPERIQVFGETEMTFLAARDGAARSATLGTLAAAGVPAFVVTKGQPPPPEMIEVCRAARVALFTTHLETGIFIRTAHRALAEILAPTTTLHGVMIDVFGVGVLLTGPSGIGKSECALELVMRGHRLVADDLVEMRLLPPASLICRSAELIKQHMEIRGLGIINVQDLFGVAAVRDQKRLELIIEMDPWNPDTDYDRLGGDADGTREILGVTVARARIPVRPGRSMSEVVEVAARNQILKFRGVDSARRFQDRILQEIRSSTRQSEPSGPKRLHDDME